MEFERNLVLKEITFLKKSNCLNLLGSEPSCFEIKNTEKSLAIRQQANELFAKKNHDEEMHEEIWKMYTKCIGYASNDSDELPAGYANRSALLLHFKKYNECLLDIDRALKLTDSNALKVKLYCRESECCLALQNGKEKASLEKAQFWLAKVDNAKERKKLREIIEKAQKLIEDYIPVSPKKEKEYEISCENTAFRISYSKKYGRHLVANRDISIGELLYTEKFHVTTINSAKSYVYCSHCLAICWATIPCDNCSFYMYCSEKCKVEAWEKYHDIECTVKFGKHPKDINDYYTQLGLRALVMGLKETGGIEKLKELTSEIDKCTDLAKKGLTEDGKFSGDNFQGIYSLSCSKSVEKVKSCIPEILKILVAFARKTDILGKEFKYTNNLDLMNNENALFIASLFVRLSSISLINAFEVMSSNYVCKKTKNIMNCRLQFCCSRGLSLSLFTSLINHSCDNNVDKFYTNDGRVVYYASQPIEKNSQIFSSYYLKFFKTIKSARQKTLLSWYEFHCDCTACKNDWPILDDDYPMTRTPLGVEMMKKHFKTLEKVKDTKDRCTTKTKTIRTFIQDTQLILKSMKRPTFIADYFLWAFCLLIEHRYFLTLDIPSTCGSNTKK